MGKNKYILLTVIFLLSDTIYATNAFRCLVFLKDKPQQFDPAGFYTASVIQRHQKFSIPFDESDKPCNPAYISEINSLGANVVGSSRWFNILQTDVSDITVLDKIKNLNYVTKVQLIGKISTTSSSSKYSGTQSCNETSEVEEDFSATNEQVAQMNGDYLHDLGFKGQGIKIAVLDNNFQRANILAPYQPIYTSNRLLGVYDYVDRDSTVYDRPVIGGHPHGLATFGLIAALKPGIYQGTAVEASFYLFRTENDASELVSEEYNLAEGLERCEELGVNVASISLGYNLFDSSSENHVYADMNGHKTIAAKAVNKASSKGILVCVAAGNEHGNSWNYITTPADADSAFTIAAVDNTGTVAGFSSEGFPSDPRIKPNVAAWGVSDAVIDSSGNVYHGSGTSFATPLLAGLSACLWQAFPSKTNWEIKTAIEQSASQYLTPDKRVGYGIPDFKKAYQSLLVASYVSNSKLENDYAVYPNPFQSSINIINHGNTVVQQVQVMNQVGQTVFLQNSPAENTVSLDNLPKGMYLLQIATNNGMIIKKLMKD